MKREPIKPHGQIVVWITGQSDAGKTTTARELIKLFDAIILDGDEMRECISKGLGMDRAGRNENNIRIAELAKVLSYQKMVIVAVIAPFEATRVEIESICDPVWIYLHKGEISALPDKPYEVPRDPDCTIDTSTMSLEESVHLIFTYLVNHTYAVGSIKSFHQHE